MLIDSVQQLLINEQRRIREFVQAMRPAASLQGEVRLSQNLRQMLSEAACNWNCELSLAVEPDHSTVPKTLAVQLSLMLSEAIANAVRHGKASKLDVAVRQTDATLTVIVRDNGCGFGYAARHNGACKLPPRSQTDPVSLRDRVGELGGSFEVIDSSTGAELRIKLPVS